MEIDVVCVKRWLEQGVDDSGTPVALLDCRETDEYETASIAGSCLAPLSQWPPDPGLIDEMQGKQVVVFCHHGGRSLRVAHWFRQNGFPNALSMAGGIDLWSQIIDPSVPRY
jgi:rhodanese-related sulfurtransferase